jgi:uncharacterized protein (TIGR02453 family)
MIAGMGDPARFERFPDASGRFFGELRLHNDRGWFEAHREEYERGWREPMAALLGEVRDRLTRVYPGIPLSEPKIFRIHRDVRFSKDKSPYKTHLGGFVAVAGRGGGGGSPDVPAAVYFHVGFEETFSGAGLYAMAPDVLAGYRTALLDGRRGAELGRIVSALRKKGFSLVAHEATKRVPPGIDPEHPRAELLKLKGLAATAPPIDGRLLTRRRLVDRLVKDATAAAPLVRWLLRNAA